MVTAEEWGYEKGEAAGEKRGIEQNKKLTAIALIGEGMDNAFISRVTKLSVGKIEKLRNKALKAVN